MSKLLLKPLPCFKKAIAFFIATLLHPGLSAQPVITSFSPVSGPPGTIVTVTGTGFNTTADSNIVYFGGVKTQAITANTTQLTVQVPPGASTGLITVTSRTLTAYSLKPFDITFGKGPKLSGSAFTPAGTIATGNYPYSMVSADIDADGKSDLILVNATSPFYIAVYHNNSTTGNISFDGPASITASSGAYDVVTGDLDGDGLPDLVVTNYNTGYITIYKNTSKPGLISFNTGQQYSTIGSPWGVDIRDMNADGKPDILFMNYGNGAISIYPNRSTSAGLELGARADFANPGFAVGLCTADINGDGLPDVVATGAARITTYINRSAPGGTILLAGTPYISTTGTPIRVEAADVDEDGKSDVILSVKSVDGMAIYRNTTTDTAIANVSYDLTLIPVKIAVGRFGVSDLDGDGHIDIATTGSPFSVIHNTSTPGTIRTDRPSAAANNNTGVAIADFDLDGRPDLASFDMNKNTLYLFRNTTEGPNIVSVTPDSAVTGAVIFLHGTNFTGTTAVKLGSAAASGFTVLSDSLISAVISPDVISDSIEVVAPLRSGVYTGYKFLNAPFLKSMTPAYGMTGSQVTINGRYFKNVTAVTFGGQPAAKFTVVSDTVITAYIGQGATGAINITSKNGTGSLAGFTYIVKSPAPVITSFAPLTGPAGTTVTINGANFGTNNIVFFGAARGTVLSATSTQLTVMAPAGATFEPLKVMTNYKTGTAGQAFGLTFEGGGMITDSSFNISSAVSFPTGNYVLELALADLDGDGLNDAAAANWGTDNVLTIARNNSVNNMLNLGTLLTYRFSGLVYSVTSGDLNSDGKPDLALAMEKGVYIFKNTSTPGHLSFDTTFIADKEATANLAIADFNNDGRPDLLCGHNFLNHFYLYRNIGVNDYITFDAPVKYSSERGGMPMRTGDIDGDGKIDIIEPNYEWKTVSVFRNTSSNDVLSLAAPVTFASGGDAADVSIGDLDGDGKPEVVACYPNQDDHVISLYTNNSTPGNLSLERHDIPTTLFGSSVCMGDLDGDGKPDLGILTQNGFNAFKNISTPGNVKMDIYHRYGSLALSNVMGIADFSGDGKPDVIATNNTTSNAYIIPNITGKNLGPSVASFTPAMATKGDTLVIKGKRFSATKTITLGGTPATFTVVNDSLMLAIAGNGSTGKLSITTPYGSVTRDSFVYRAPLPVISGFRPQSATTGDTVRISGANFSSVTAVTMGNIPAAGFTIITDTSIYAIVGTGASGNIQVANLTDTISNAGFIYVAPPTPSLTYFSPASAATGMRVTLRGKNLDKTTQVFFSGIAAASFIITSDTTITAVVGSGASGPVTVNTTAGMASIPGFTFRNAAPLLSYFSPATAGYGDTVTIHGYELYNVTAVSLGGYSATTYKVLNDSTVIAVAGMGNSGNVKVVSNGIGVTLSGFTYQPRKPVITYFTPTAAATGDQVTIKGYNFINVNDVKFGIEQSDSFRIVNDSTIIAIVGYGGTDYITVTTSADTTYANGFTYLAPAITTFSPASGTAGDTVRFYGSHLTGVKNITFGGMPPAYERHDANMITAILGNGATGAIIANYYGAQQGIGQFTYMEPKPVFNSFYPTSAAKGTTVYIFGTFNGKVTGITFGGYPVASFNQDSSNFITAVLGNGGTGNIVVTMDTVSLSKSGFTYIQPARTITGISPASGTTGTVVKISGTNLKDATRVLFGGVAATSFSSDANTVTAVVSNGATGKIMVAYTNDTLYYSGFTYIAAVQQPMITAISPASGTTGTIVKIYGTALLDATAVSFGGIPAASFTTDSNSITAVVATGKTGDVSVTTPTGTTTYSSFTFVSLQPVITSVTPPSGSKGFAIRIIGINLDSTYAVSFGGTPAVAFTIDTNFITAILGDGSSGDVSISTPYGNATFPGFEFTASVQTIDVYPNPVQNGTVVIRHPASNKTSYITITDMNGMQLLKFDVAAGQTVTTISGLNLQAGMYQVKWTDNNKKLVQRIVVP